MFVARCALFAALVATGADAFMAPGSLPLQRSRTMAHAGISRVRCQEKGESVPQPDMFEAKPVATGGTDYSKVPKKEVTPLFLIPSTSVIGDGKMVGDKGFDPMGLATSMEKLNKYREAELKHCRLAMLAALGWPLAEVLQGPLSRALGLPDLLVSGQKCVNAAECSTLLSRAPSVLNGGLDQISPIYWGVVIALSAAIEFYGLQIQKKDNYLPGDLGFDPLRIYQGLSPTAKLDMQLKEINNGRLAMIAITGYAFNEAATKISVAGELGIAQ